MTLESLQRTLLGRFVVYFFLYAVAKVGSSLAVQLIRHNSLENLSLSTIFPRDMLIYGVPIVFVIALFRRPKVEP